ncbi:unnamed protein product [Linum trigynum]|uniref:DUF4283 domain-containing protein n=1 Tax=Linum trigynum TaxID=586398 RepID=A0AAV2FZ71_9ROSI
MAASSSDSAPTTGKVLGGCTWAQLFDIAPENRMKYRPPERVNDGFRIPREVKQKGEERWRDCLIGQFVGAQPKVAQLQTWATSIWGGDGAVRVSRFGPRLFVFQFRSASTSKWVFRSGPWHYQGNQLYLRKWTPGIQSVAPQVESLPIWVNIWGIPLEYHSVEGLEWVASTVGPPLWMDKTTRVGGQLGYAKVCVDLAADCGFPSSIRLYPDEDPSFAVEVEYLNLPRVCPVCAVYGHDCNALARSNKKWVVKHKVQSNVETGSGEAFVDSGVLSVVGSEMQTGVEPAGSHVVQSVVNAVLSDKAQLTEPVAISVDVQDISNSSTNGNANARFVDVVMGSSVVTGSPSALLQQPVVASPPVSGKLVTQNPVLVKEINPWITVGSKKKPTPPKVLEPILPRKGGRIGKKK